MYSGPGAGSMMAAASAWDGLAGELHATAGSYRALLSGLTAGPWMGPAAAAMSAAAAPHLTWLDSTALLAEQAGAQAAAAVAAYEAAFSGTVPPAEVAANRALLAQLVATNIFGQNTPAIAVVEAEYAEMWAQDAGVMYGYAGSSAQAAALEPFTPPTPTTTPTALAGQAAAVSQAVGSTAAADVPQLQQLISNLPNTLGSMAALNPLASALGLPVTLASDSITFDGPIGDVVAALTGSATLDAGSGIDAFIRLVSPTRLFATTFRDITGLGQTFFPPAKAAAEAAKALEALPHNFSFSGLGSGGLGGLGGIGKAAQIGGLSVPNAWASATPGIGRMATLPLATPGAVAEAAAPSEHMLGGMPLTGGLGRGLGAANAPRYGFHPTVMTRPPFAG
ncbi:PPE family protein [Mycobacterium asiaticum]|uniref:PPE family protein n=1 Tax=Mycobacterium asiaticum TaxID=1790 RepID=A0A1A3MX84_MYCAS|nr:PPE family protein [Mycobacterium asiaticum]OBK12767.1 hypothetical protein A5636_10670 [Mycobacterium asiaticum]